MPEVAELATSRDRLRQILIGREISQIGLGPSGRYLKAPPDGYERISEWIGKSPAKIEEINTKGKFMWWTLTFPGDLEVWYMFNTYGMSGGWAVNRSNHTALSVVTVDKTSVFFNDPRRFGTVKFVRGAAELKKKLKTLGPCVLGEEITSEIMSAALCKKPGRPICEALLDQSGVSGIGNYLRAEILYASKINPWRTVSQISPPEWESLALETARIVKSAYASQGASIYTFKGVDGDPGAAQFSFKVYGEKSDPGGRVILREDDANGRTIHWCPEVQV
jgi:DNA-formamidopyrimidine glycosylase